MLDTAASWRRCLRNGCPDRGKRLRLDVGQDDSGDVDRGLTVVHRCDTCGYSERGPRNPTVARRTSATVIARMLQARLDGWVVPLKTDTEPWPEETL